MLCSMNEPERKDEKEKRKRSREITWKIPFISDLLSVSPSLWLADFFFFWFRSGVPISKSNPKYKKNSTLFKNLLFRLLISQSNDQSHIEKPSTKSQIGSPLPFYRYILPPLPSPPLPHRLCSPSIYASGPSSPFTSHRISVQINVLRRMYAGCLGEPRISLSRHPTWMWIL